MRSTHTYVTMDISAQAYAEIRAKMLAADYGHTLDKDDGEEVIDMHGLALKSLPVTEPPPARERAIELVAMRLNLAAVTVRNEMEVGGAAVTKVAVEGLETAVNLERLLLEAIPLVRAHFPDSAADLKERILALGFSAL